MHLKCFGWICKRSSKQNVKLPHFWSSSEPSPQSSEPSHTQWLNMQRWFPHSNWLDVQNLSAKGEKSALRMIRKTQRVLCLGIKMQLWEKLTTVCFICSILTVVLLITGPAHWNATAAGTSKEVHWTLQLFFICKNKGKNMINVPWGVRKYYKYIKEGREKPHLKLDSFFHQKSLHSHC